MTYSSRDLLTRTAIPQSMVTGYDEDTDTFNTARVDQAGHLYQDSYVWDTGTMAWIPAEPGGSGTVSVVGLKNIAGTQINPATLEVMEDIHDDLQQELSLLNASTNNIEADVNNLVGFEIPPYNYISLGYTGLNLTSVTYKTGGSGGTTVATLTLGYNGSDLSSITRS